MPTPIFDPRSEQYKTPYGAAPCGTKISLTLRPALAEGFVSCALLWHAEFAGETRETPLAPAGTSRGRALFTGAYTLPRRPELVWYRFRLRRKDGETLWLGKNGLCAEMGEALSWQQTVYDDSLPTPEWFGRGVSYQIFPDRFRRTSLPDPAGMLGNRRVHEDWFEGMDYLPDENGAMNSDFFGGDLAGIEEKLDYLHTLGVTTLYLCPIFESDSNHRYNTGDYERIDPMLGTEEDFRRLCEKARALGIHIMLDGVFNHTGSNSRYFNALAAYPDSGAAQSKDSPFYPWYTFQEYPTRYTAWWGVHTLPAVNEETPSYLDYIVESRQSIIRRWLRAGADAWRLDVADELPDEFIARIRAVMTEEKPDSFLLGEVWEDGSNKIAYDRRRKYLLGRETHGLMNYTFRTAALAYLRGGPAEDFMEAMETIRENYPAPAFYSCMNLLGSHDTPRILTLLGTFPGDPPASREERSTYRMTEQERQRGLRLLRLGSTLLYAFPGSPTVYYGDEAGMEGFEDPFNRAAFPWGRENRELQAHYIRLGQLRNSRPSLQSGALRWLRAEGGVLAFARDLEAESTAVLLNAGPREAAVTVPWPGRQARDAFTGKILHADHGRLTVPLPPGEGTLLL